MVRRNKTHESPPGNTTRSDDESASRVAAFGPFRVRATDRVLEKDGVPLKIGSRAFDILVALLRSAPEAISHRELMSRVWGSLVVDEGNLRFQIAALRKALGEIGSDVPHVANIPGRGYCIAAPVVWTSVAPGNREDSPAVSPAQLPGRLLRMIGRDREVSDLVAQLRAQRFVSIVGAGGIGKTTVALAVAHEVLSEFAGAVHFLDLSTIHDPQHVARGLAAQLGLTTISDSSLPGLLNHLRERRMLLVLDNCEHLIEVIATFAEAIFQDAPRVHVLATSRESLRAAGEWVYHLSALECPPLDAVSLTASQALTFPAVQLFVKQATASGYPFELNDEDAPVLAELCRRLDGIALALELAARRVGVHGLRRIASLLDDQFRLLWRGRRTALPRHQTLGATLDWSYNLLSQPEQRILRHLAIFVGAFSLEDAVAVVGEGLGSAEVAEIIAALVDKSLVALDPAASLRYRLLDTARAYALQRLKDSGEHRNLARRNCAHLCASLGRFGVTAAIASRPDAVAFFSDHLANLHAAQEWAFSSHGDAALGVRLAAACAPLYLQLSLLPECIASSERALNVPDAAGRGTRVELELQVCFCISLLYSKGNVPAVRAAIDRGLQLAEELRDAPTQLLLLHQLINWLVRSGDYRGLAETSKRFEVVARALQDPLANAIAHVMVAVTSSYAGDLREVPKYTRAALSSPTQPSKLSAASFGHVHKTGARSVCARGLWLLGFPDQALTVAGESVAEAVELGHPGTIAYVIASAVFVYLRTGRWARVDALTEQLSVHVAKHRLSTYAPVGIGWQGSLAVLRGQSSLGTELLQRAIGDLRAGGYGLYVRVLSAALADGYAKAGRHDLAYRTICEAIAWSEDHGPSLDLTELLRVKGEIVIARSPAAAAEGEACLMKSLGLAGQQSLLSMELRISMSLARLWADQGLFGKALELLDGIHGRFTEGFATRDLVAAANLLADLRSRVAGGG
jgi:predicted ATPase/DNA-binding winged helix-turn-helix (wHTH) protein